MPLMTEPTSQSENVRQESGKALRRIFDAIIDYTLPITPSSSLSSQPTSKSNISLEPFTQSQLPSEAFGVMDNVMGGINVNSIEFLVH
jgi:hypothetical protein